MHITKLDNITYRLGYNGYIVLLSQNERLKRPIIKKTCINSKKVFGICTGDWTE